MSSNVQEMREQVRLLKEEMRETTIEISKLRRMLYTVIMLLNTLGLPPPFDAIIRKIQQVITFVLMLRTNLILLESTTSWGAVSAALGMVGVVSVGFSNLTDSLKGYRR